MDKKKGSVLTIQSCFFALRSISVFFNHTTVFCVLDAFFSKNSNHFLLFFHCVPPHLDTVSLPFGFGVILACSIGTFTYHHQQPSLCLYFVSLLHSICCVFKIIIYHLLYVQVKWQGVEYVYDATSQTKTNNHSLLLPALSHVT